MKLKTYSGFFSKETNIISEKWIDWIDRFYVLKSVVRAKPKYPPAQERSLFRKNLIKQMV